MPIGFPIILKAVSGGGGKGMRVVESNEEIDEVFNLVQNEALNAFKNDEIYIEKFLIAPRHIEVQILADKFNNIYILGDRDCSVQRNHQKIIEESPSPRVDSKMREENNIKEIYVGHELQNKNKVHVIYDTPAPATIQKMMQNPEVQKVMKDAGNKVETMQVAVCSD